MAEFRGLPVAMTPLDNLHWRIEGEIEYRSDVAGMWFRVPKGFRTDFASVPRPLWMIYPRWGSYGYAAIVHDYLYGDGSALVTRMMADRVFLEAMLCLGVPRVRAYLLFSAVRFGGGFCWTARTP